MRIDTNLILGKKMIYVLLFLGFIFLIKGADLLVSGSSAIAEKFKVPHMVIGLTVLSFGTSLPELIVSIISNLNGSADIAVGNIFGSNISNTFLVLGIAAIIYKLPIRKNTIKAEIPFSIFTVMTVGFFANMSLTYSGIPLISRWEGSLLILLFIIFLVYIYRIAKKFGENPGEDEIDFENLPNTGKAIFLILIGITGLYFGGDWVVKSAIKIAEQFGLSEALIGLTVIAIGTSLPELVTSAVAAYKKNADMAVGNVVGSNIFNIIWILGCSSIIKPLEYNIINNFDILIVLLSGVLLLAFILIGKDKSLGRKKGIFFILLYVSYLFYIVIRG